jgi:hypothetical protein
VRPDPDPRKLPAIRVDLRDFVIDARSFGHVEAEFARGTAGMTLNKFTMSRTCRSLRRGTAAGSYATRALNASSTSKSKRRM